MWLIPRCSRERCASPAVTHLLPACVSRLSIPSVTPTYASRLTVPAGQPVIFLCICQHCSFFLLDAPGLTQPVSAQRSCIVKTFSPPPESECPLLSEVALMCAHVSFMYSCIQQVSMTCPGLDKGLETEKIQHLPVLMESPANDTWNYLFSLSVCLANYTACPHVTKSLDVVGINTNNLTSPSKGIYSFSRELT